MLKRIEGEIFEIKESNIHKSSWIVTIKDTNDYIVIRSNEIEELVQLLERAKQIKIE